MYVSLHGLGGRVRRQRLPLLFVALAAVFRYRADVWRRQQLEVRNEGGRAGARAATPSPTTSAIAVQAQAGGVVAGTRPDKAVEVPPRSSPRRRAPRRDAVDGTPGAREDDPVEYAPRLGSRTSLPWRTRTARPVEVSLAGSLDRLPRPVDAAVYRLAQEALTNAVRHAERDRVAIDVCREGEAVRLRVTDDGRTDRDLTRRPGFGLLGTAERAQLLGGTFAAGPAPDGGWVVEAELPVEVSGVTIRVVVADDRTWSRPGW